MSEYIPITEDVRDTYVEGRWEMFPDSKRDDLYWASEFDRWLAERDREIAARAWDEGRNAEPVHDGGHDVYCSEYECFCDTYVNPYRDVKRANSLDGSTRASVRFLTGFTDVELDELGGLEREKK